MVRSSLEEMHDKQEEDNKLDFTFQKSTIDSKFDDFQANN